MIRKYGFFGLFMTFSLFCNAQLHLQAGKWKGTLQRQDGHHIPFELEIEKQGKKHIFYIINDTERMRTEDVITSKDSLLIKMPVFESYFRVKVINKDSLNGVWVKGGSAKDLVMPFYAISGRSRFPQKSTEAPQQVAGKWKIEFTRADQTKRPAIGEFSQEGQNIRGSVLTPAGDYRYLAGIMAADSMFLSTFDGVHALFFAAKITSGELKGNYYSSASIPEPWVAVKDENASLDPPVTTLKEGADGFIDFSFKDLEGNKVSLKDKRFRDKVVVLQLMGSWCPNCMDEMAFLSEYYRKNKNRGIEVIALAYELSTDEARSRKSLKKFQNQFKVEYPMLITGVTVADPQRTEKTLPQLTQIKVFPTTVFLDKKGRVSKINTSFYGPGTGKYHTAYKEEFEKTITKLLE